MKNLIIAVLMVVVTHVSNGQNVLGIIEDSGSGTEWLNDKYYDYDYNSDDLLLDETMGVWDDVENVYDDALQRQHIYDVNGNLISVQRNVWSEQDNEWLWDELIAYTHDAAGLVLTETIQYAFLGDDWENHLRYLYTYDNESRVECKILQNWSNISGEYFDVKKEDYWYSDDGTEEINSIGLWNGEEFQTEEIQTKIYDEEGLLESYVSVIIEDGEELNSFEYFYFYDDDQRLIFETFFSVYDFGQITSVNTETTYLYNDQGLLDQEINLLWSPILQEWVNAIRRTYIYAPTGIDSPEFSNLNIYPIPAENHITIDGLTGAENQIEIVDVSGKVVFSELSNRPSISIDLNDLRPALYFLRLTNREGTKVHKFVKE